MACEQGNLSVAHTAMANGLAQASTRLIGQLDQAAANATNAWTANLQSPTQREALAYRTTEEAHGGSQREPASGT